MTHHTDDGVPGAVHAIVVGDLLADGVLARPILAGQNCIHQGNSLSSATVVQGEIAAHEYGDAKGGEVSRRDHADIAVRSGVIR